jgi:hypothetical protein
VGSGRHPDGKLEGIGGKIVGSRELANMGSRLVGRWLLLLGGRWGSW